MRRLIFGCGYLGRRVAAAWNKSGDEVFALTRSEVNAQSLRESGIKPIVGDVTDPSKLTGLPQVETVLHAVGFDRNADPTKREVYVNGLRNVLTAIAGRCERLIHISSTSVYGQCDGEVIDEESPAEADHESGAICRDAGRLVPDFTAATGTAATILRLSGIYGRGRLLSRVEAIREGLILPGPADSWLNLIHVEDAAQVALAAAATDEANLSPLYLVSDDQPVRRMEYYESLARLVDGPAPEFDPQTTARHTRGLGKRCRNKKMKSELGVTLWFPTIETGLPDALTD